MKKERRGDDNNFGDSFLDVFGDESGTGDGGDDVKLLEQLTKLTTK